MTAFGIQCPEVADEDFPALVAAAKTGDRGARDTLLLASLPYAEAVLVSRFRREDRDDMLSMLSVTIAQSVPLFDPGRGEWRAYVIGRMINRMRKFVHVRKCDAGWCKDDRLGASQYVGPDEIDDGTIRGRVRAAIDSLSPRQREVIEGRYFGEETLQQTADRLGMSKEGVRQSEIQALARLAKIVGVGP